MNIEQLFENFQSDDLRWFVPVAAGLAIIVFGLLIGLLRGMTGGVLLGLVVGGVMVMSPVLLDALERPERGGTAAGSASNSSAVVARGAAQLSVLNAEVVTELSRVVSTLRNTIAGLEPLVSPEVGADGVARAPDPLVAQRFTSSLTDTEQKLDLAIASLQRANTLRERLVSDMDALELEMRRAAAAR